MDEEDEASTVPTNADNTVESGPVASPAEHVDPYPFKSSDTGMNHSIFFSDTDP